MFESREFNKDNGQQIVQTNITGKKDKVYNKVLYRRLASFSVYKCVVNSWGAFCTRRVTRFKSTRFFKHFFKESLNIFILKLYTNGFTIEFANCRTWPNHSNVGGKHCQQNALMVYTTKLGNQKISDTATTM